MPYFNINNTIHFLSENKERIGAVYHNTTTYPLNQQIQKKI